MRGARIAAAVLFVAGVAAMVEAQQPGRGGFGGGFGIGPTQLVQNEAVQKDLKVTDEQAEKLKTWAKEFAAKSFEANKAKYAELKDASKEERDTKFAAIRAEDRATAYKELDSVLKPEQVTRLKQIELQASGMRAYQTPAVAEGLKLTDSQKSKIKGIIEEYNKDSAELGGGFGGGKGGKGGGDKEKAAENEKKREKLRKSAQADIDDVLTDDQRKAWKDMTGEPFDRTKLFGGFGGNRPQPKKQD